MPGAHGSLTITPDGAWTYEVDNDLPEVQGLAQGQFLTDTVLVTSADGTEQAITVTINGSDEPIVISGDLASAVTEDVQVDGDGNLVASGQLDMTGGSAGFAASDNRFLPREDVQIAADGITTLFGSFSIDSNGAWTYTVDNELEAVQSLGAGETLTESVFVTDSSVREFQTVTITINGADEPRQTCRSVL